MFTIVRLRDFFILKIFKEEILYCLKYILNMLRKIIFLGIHIAKIGGKL